jgi:hypothetical protein
VVTSWFGLSDVLIGVGFGSDLLDVLIGVEFACMGSQGRACMFVCECLRLYGAVVLRKES